MSEIKKMYVIEWMGPYDNLDEMYEREETLDCCIYMITGRLPYERSKGIKYVGITERDPCIRLKEKDHRKKQEAIKDKQYWAGRFSVSAYNNLYKHRAKAELIEHLFVRFLYHFSDGKMINDKKTKTNPKCPIVVLSRGQKKRSEEERFNKPSALSDLPDVLMYADGRFYTSEKLKFTLSL